MLAVRSLCRNIIACPMLRDARHCCHCGITGCSSFMILDDSEIVRPDRQDVGGLKTSTSYATPPSCTWTMTPLGARGMFVQAMPLACEPGFGRFNSLTRVNRGIFIPGVFRCVQSRSSRYRRRASGSRMNQLMSRQCGMSTCSRQVMPSASIHSRSLSRWLIRMRRLP